MNLVVFVAAYVVLGPALALITDEGQARQYIDGLYKKGKRLCYETALREWVRDTADPAGNEDLQKSVNEKLAETTAFNKGTTNEFEKYDWKKFSDPKLRRMFLLWSNYGDMLLPDNEKKDLDKTEQDIKDAINNVKMKEFNSQDPTPKLNYVDMIDRVTKNYKNADELKFYWTEYHNNAGRPVKPLFEHWLSLKQNEARLNHKENLVKFWEFDYEVDNFEATAAPLMKAIEPLYHELHAYLRFRLWNEYGKNNDIINPKGPIPASLLGAGWEAGGRDLVRYRPYVAPTSFDINPGLETQGMRGKKAVEVIDGYFQSLGFEKLPDSFYEKSIFEKKGKMSSYENAYSFCNVEDFRVKLCTEPNQESFNEAIRTVGFIEFMKAVRHQPYVFDELPNIPFGTALFEVFIALFNAPNNLKSLGLLSNEQPVSKEIGINMLFKEAVDWLMEMPYALAYDEWRWHVIEGKIPPKDYNCAFWRLVTEYHGVEPPVDRTNEDFDPGTPVRLASGQQGMKNFLVWFIKYDMLRGLCREAGYYDPQSKPDNLLVFCDIRDSRAAGEKLKEAMSLGKSQPWNEVLKVITGQNRIDPSALLEYYKPLQDWLHQENKRNQVTLGWPERRERCH